MGLRAWRSLMVWERVVRRSWRVKTLGQRYGKFRLNGKYLQARQLVCYSAFTRTPELSPKMLPDCHHYHCIVRRDVLLKQAPPPGQQAPLDPAHQHLPSQNIETVGNLQSPSAQPQWPFRSLLAQTWYPRRGPPYPSARES